MKFECPSCGKKYSLPDEKVPAGKDFKVKCKKCSEIIVLRGPGGEVSTAQAGQAASQGSARDPGFGAPFAQAPLDDGMGPDEQPTRVFDYSRMGAEGELSAEDQGPADFVSAQAGAFQSVLAESAQEAAPAAPPPQMDDFEWHIAVDGDQMGPYETVQIREMLAARQINDETFAWRDGFSDWLPIREIPELMGGGASFAAAASPFAAADTGPAADSPFAIGSGGAKSHDLFASPGSDGTSDSPFGAAGGGGAVSTSLGAAPQSPRVEAGQLKGARHENSVLFSLSSLQALASSSRDPSPGGLGVSHGLGAATSEGGSGLIDIRAMTAGVSPSFGDGKPSDDILSIGGQGIGSPMGVPSLLQPVKQEPSKLPYILGSIGGLVVIGILVVVLVVVLKGKDSSEGTVDEDALRQKILAELIAQGMGKAEAEKIAAEQAAVQATDGEETTGTPGEGEAEAEDDEASAEGDSKKPGARKKKKGGTDTAAEEGGSKSTPTPTKTETPGKSPSKGTIEDDLMAALKGGGTKKKVDDDPKPEKKTPTPPPAVASGLPEKPTKAEVMAALQGITPKVKSCGKGWHGVAKTSINVGGATGKVMSATVVDGPTDAALKSCIVNAVKTASFPKFEQKKFTVAYPFVI